MGIQIIERPFQLTQPDEPFTAVRLGKLFRCTCDPVLLQGASVEMVCRELRKMSEQSGFAVIGDHTDLYGDSEEERRTFGWTVNLTYAQSGGSFDAWHAERTVDVNLHWCDEHPIPGKPSRCVGYEYELLRLIEGFFAPEVAMYSPRQYAPLSWRE